MLVNLLLSDFTAPPGTPSNFSRFTPDLRYSKLFNTERIDWLSFRETTQNNGIPVTTFDYTEANGRVVSYSTFSSEGSIATAAGAGPVGISSYAPNIYINANESEGHNFNIQSQSGGPWGSNSFASYNQTLDGPGVNIVPSSWSLDIIQPVPGTSMTIGTVGSAHPPGALLCPMTWTTGIPLGTFIFRINATSVDGLTTNQVFIWNLFY